MRLTIDHAPDHAEPAPDAGFGALRTDRGNLPLRAMDVRAQITAMIAGVEIVQDFANPFDVPLEATYVFPLPDRGAVTALRMQADGRVIEGVLTEREQARRDYEAAIEAGQRAAIAEEDRPDVFTMRVGNILPGEQVTITLAMTAPLPYADGDVTFRFPLVVAPRYIPGSPLADVPADSEIVELPGVPAGTGATDSEAVPLPYVPTGTGVAADTDAVPDASRISPPVLLPGFPNPVRLSVSAAIDPAGLVLTGIRSSLHAVTQESAENGHVIVWLAPGERLNRDLILRLTVADPASVTGSLVVCPDEPGPVLLNAAADLGVGTFMLTLVPPSTAPAGPPRDVVIVLDRSGSMGGWKMVAARRAAARIIDTLGAQDRFAALCFDNEIVQPPEQANRLVAGTDRNRFRAVEFLAGMSARGGTEMLPALSLAARLLSFTAGEEASRQRVLVLVTDGQVGNEDQILAELSPRLSATRVHVVGIDRAVNAGFLTRLATIGRGRCELVESQDRLDEVMAVIHQRIASPVVTGLTVEPANVRVVAGSTAPARLPDLFAGAPVLISGRFDADDLAGGPASITVRGTCADGSRYEQVLTAAPGQGGAATATWARGFLRELEDRYTCLTVGSPGELAGLEALIVAVSLRFGVLCRFTAFLAVDTRVVTEGGTPHRVTQPVELPSGWELAGIAGGYPPSPPAVPQRLDAVAGFAGSMPQAARAPGGPSAQMLQLGYAPGGPPASMPQPGGAPQAMPGAAPAGGARSARARRVRPGPLRRSRTLPEAHEASTLPEAHEASTLPEAREASTAPTAAPRPAGVVPQARETGTAALPQWAIDQIRAELKWLDATPGARTSDLPRDLADLGSRLAAMLASLSSHGVEPGRLAGLRELVAKLQPGLGGRIGSADAAELRERARATLRELLGDRRPASPFWKRASSSR